MGWGGLTGIAHFKTKITKFHVNTCVAKKRDGAYILEGADLKLRPDLQRSAGKTSMSDGSDLFFHPYICGSARYDCEVTYH